MTDQLERDRLVKEVLDDVEATSGPGYYDDDASLRYGYSEGIGRILNLVYSGHAGPEILPEGFTFNDELGLVEIHRTPEQQAQYDAAIQYNLQSRGLMGRVAVSVDPKGAFTGVFEELPTQDIIARSQTSPGSGEMPS